MTKEKIKEYKEKLKEVKDGWHGRIDYGLLDLATEVYNDLSDEKWARELYKKSILEFNKENEISDTINYFHGLSRFANEIYNNFDKDWGNTLYNDIINSQSPEGILDVADNLISAKIANDESKLRGKELLIKLLNIFDLKSMLLC